MSILFICRHVSGLAKAYRSDAKRRRATALVYPIWTTALLNAHQDLIHSKWTAVMMNARICLCGSQAHASVTKHIHSTRSQVPNDQPRCCAGLYLRHLEVSFRCTPFPRPSCCCFCCFCYYYYYYYYYLLLLLLFFFLLLLLLLFFFITFRFLVSSTHLVIRLLSLTRPSYLSHPVQSFPSALPLPQIQSLAGARAWPHRGPVVRGRQTHSVLDRDMCCVVHFVNAKLLLQSFSWMQVWGSRVGFRV